MCDRVTGTKMSGFKVDSEGNVLVTRKYNTDYDGIHDLGIYWGGDRFMGSMDWNTKDNTLGFVVSVTYLMTPDSLTHNAAIRLVLDGKDMSVIRNAGQASSHSFGSSLHVSEDGTKFIGADLGDGFPRGINLWEFSKSGPVRGKDVYASKVKHCTDGKCAGEYTGYIPTVYEEVSTGARTFYTQSNDNQVCMDMCTVLRMQVQPYACANPSPLSTSHEGVHGDCSTHVCGGTHILRAHAHTTCAYAHPYP